MALPDPGYRYSLQTFAADGVTTDFRISFADGYLNPAYVYAKAYDSATNANEEMLSVQFLSIGPSSDVRVTPVQPVGRTVEIFRYTPREAALVDFKDRSMLTAENLNTITRQAINAVAEIEDRSNAVQEAVLNAVDRVQEVADAVETVYDQALKDLVASYYAVPVIWEPSLSVTLPNFTVSHEGAIYSANPEALPFVTGAVFNPANWRLMQGVTFPDLSIPTGSSALGFVQPFAGAVTRTALAKLRESVSTADWGIVGDGSNETAKWLTMAAQLPAGGVLNVLPGTHTLHGTVDFVQDDITVRFAHGARVVQASGTPTIDSLLRFSGIRQTVLGVRLDANLAGNPTATGRGQMLDLAGSHCIVEDFFCEGSQHNGFGTGLYVTGNHNLLRDIRTNNTGANAIRNRGDFNSFEGLRLMNWRGHAFAQDAALGNVPQTYTSIRGGVFLTNSATATEAILTDPDGIQAGRIDVTDVYMDNPGNTHANILKFVYMNQVNLTNVTCRHAAGPLNCSLRTQEEVARMTIRNCRFDGAVVINGAAPLDLVIGGASVICEKYNAGSAVQGVNSSCVIEDGVALMNLSNAAVSTSSVIALSNAAQIKLGSLIYHGVAGSPCAVQLTGYSVLQLRRIRAGQISVASPLRVSGTMRSIKDGRWVGLSDTQDACSRQGDERVFLAANLDLPPRESEGWQAGDRVIRRIAAAGQPSEYVCILAGGNATPWVGAQAVTLYSWRSANGNIYACTQAGTTAAAGTGPAGSSPSIADGSAIWTYISPAARWLSTGITN